MNNQDEVERNVQNLVQEFESRAMKINVKSSSASKNKVLRQGQAHGSDGIKRSNEESANSAGIIIEDEGILGNGSNDVKKELKQNE